MYLAMIQYQPSSCIKMYYTHQRPTAGWRGQEKVKASPQAAA